ncbi:uncharacterized protein LOC133795634 [Humulus lupulus]|uniref:uncharacterized protein LOC133795634 n=1 Tax=Humulus lupulus TaxID=3486 RepID=UPI002B403A41|nr:uncharacterized protein LOC133795634 [Humulus lupulus]
MTVAEYTQKFDRLDKFSADLVSTDRVRKDQFIRGLKPMIARDVEIVSAGGIISYAQALDRALTAERMEDIIWKDNTAERDAQRDSTKGNQDKKRKNNKSTWSVVPDKKARDNKGGSCSRKSYPEYPTYSGATHSYVADRIVDTFDWQCELYAIGFGTMLPTGEVVMYFDVILGMDWLAKYGDTIDCKSKMVRFTSEGQEPFMFIGATNGTRIPIVTTLKARKMLRNRCMGFMANVIDTNKKVMQDHTETRIVPEFLDVFPEELPGLPPHREIEFTIELAPETTPIS